MLKFFLSCLLLGLLLPTSSWAQLPIPTQAAPGDSVQAVLHRFAQEEPMLVAFIPETGRWYLRDPRREAVPEYLTESLQDAFFYDVNQICQVYGRLYLADWQTLMSKAARETFWGASFLCNRTFNYFGIRSQGKRWTCEVFNFCETQVKDDPEPTHFVVFPTFEASLWMFVHTIYNRHFLERLPDEGQRVAAAIAYERRTGVHYWEQAHGEYFYAFQLPGPVYSAEELIYTWSEHPVNNYCTNCDRQTDREWTLKVWTVGQRARF